MNSFSPDAELRALGKDEFRKKYQHLRNGPAWNATSVGIKNLLEDLDRADADAQRTAVAERAEQGLGLQQESVEIAREANEIATSANTIASVANVHASTANKRALVAVILAGLAILAEILLHAF